MMKR